MAAQWDPGQPWGRRPEDSKDKHFLSVLVLLLPSPDISVTLPPKPLLPLLPSASFHVSLISYLTDSFVSHHPAFRLLVSQSILCSATQEIILKHTSVHDILLLKSIHWFPITLRILWIFTPSPWNAHPFFFLEKDSSFITSSEKPSQTPLGGVSPF